MYLSFLTIISIFVVATSLVASVPLQAQDVELQAQPSPVASRFKRQLYPGPGMGPGAGMAEEEYDDGYNNGFGYGARVGSRETARANYLAYYGIGVYGASGGYGRSDCYQRCQQSRRGGCAAFCRSYG